MAARRQLLRHRSAPHRAHPSRAAAGDDDRRCVQLAGEGSELLGRYALGGLIASAVGIGAITSFFSIGTWLIAIGGALLLLVIYNTVVIGGGRGRRASSV